MTHSLSHTHTRIHTQVLIAAPISVLAKISIDAGGVKAAIEAARDRLCGPEGHTIVVPSEGITVQLLPARFLAHGPWPQDIAGKRSTTKCPAHTLSVLSPASRSSEGYFLY